MAAPPSVSPASATPVASAPAASASALRDRIVAALEEARARTLLLIEPVSDEDLGVQHDPLMSPILWDLGHIAHFEE